MPLVDREALSLAYTPGVAEVCSAIHEDERLARTYTWRSRLVAVVSDGTAVLGLGNIGPAAALPVMEGKAALFSEFAGLNAVPIVLSTTDPDEIVEHRRAHRAVLRRDQPRGHLGAAVLRDRGSGCASGSTSRSSTTTSTAPRSSCWPRCATPPGSPAASSAQLRVVVSGAGAAGVACTRMLLAAGIGDIAVADSRGILHPRSGGPDRGEGGTRAGHQPSAA